VYNFAALLGAERTNAMLRHLGKPIRTVLHWQLAATAAMTIAAALLAGAQTAVSAAAGGSVSVVAGLASAFVASRSDAKSAGGILFGALRAEAVKLGIAVLLLWLVLVGGARRDLGRAESPPGFCRAADRVRRRSGERNLFPGRSQQVHRSRRAHGVRVGCADERDGSPADRHDHHRSRLVPPA